MAKAASRNTAIAARTMESHPAALLEPAAERDETGRDAAAASGDDGVAANKGVSDPSRDERLTVYFDGACPLCAKEIGFYRRRPGANNLCWVDISETHGDRVAPDLAYDDAMARFHVRNPDGSLESGGAAFSRLWLAMPGFRLFGRLARIPPIAWLMEWAYRFFLRFRPRLQRLAARRQ